MARLAAVSTWTVQARPPHHGRWLLRAHEPFISTAAVGGVHAFEALTGRVACAAWSVDQLELTTTPFADYPARLQCRDCQRAVAKGG
jgi:hypothetical protein